MLLQRVLKTHPLSQNVLHSKTTYHLRVGIGGQNLSEAVCQLFLRGYPVNLEAAGFDLVTQKVLFERNVPSTLVELGVLRQLDGTLIVAFQGEDGGNPELR